MRRLPVTPAMAKRELRLRAMFHEAESNPPLAKYMRQRKTSLLTALSDWSTCAIVDALNARFVLNSTVGTDTFASDIPGELATRVCAIIGEGEGSAEEVPGGWSVTVEDLPTDQNWPVDQKRLAGICKTGFLYLGNDIVATTSHGGCYTDNLLCVFDFKLGDGASEAPTFYSNSQVRRVDSVLVYGFDDWSLLRLSEPIAREPLQPSDVEIQNSDHVFALGHPYGLPLKFVGVNDVVCDVDDAPEECRYFNSDLVMYSDNSGSPIFRTDGSLVGLYVSHYGDTLIEYSSSETCYLLEGLSCDKDEEADLSDCCVANFCGTASAVRITEVQHDAEAEEPEVVVIVNNASNTAYLQMSDAMESIIQLEPNEELRTPLHETSAVWLLSCGQQDADWKCELMRFRVKRGQRWRIMDEQSPDFDIRPGTRKVMERVEPK